ncbi:MAG: hypothetical protein C0399_08625 [Syntrophus sp. (in: bacteria)]|nr:hypothetical protein [Syntrophus sp. (in: bacteria)]
MDKGIGELLHLLPGAHFERGLVAGFPEEDMAEAMRRLAGVMETVSLGKMAACAKEAFDLVFCFFPAYPGFDQIQDVLRITAPGGAIAIIMPTHFFRVVRTQRVMGGASIYGLSPSLNDLRLAVPVENWACAAASLALYQPSRILAKARKYLAYCLSRLGLSTIWTPWLLLTAEKDGGKGQPGLHSLFQEIFGCDVEIGLFTGTPGYLRKSTMQIMNASGSILGYAKIGANPQTQAIVSNEAVMLSRLPALDLGDILTPGLLFYGDTEGGNRILIQSTQKEHMSSAPLIPDERHFDFISRLFRSTGKAEVFRESACFREIADRLADLREYAGEDRMKTLNDAFAWASQTIDAAKIPLCLAHRDFTPWNTFLVKKKLYVFDWEFAREPWIPLCDTFHFVLQKGILVDHADEGILWKRLTGDAFKEGRFLKRCAASAGITEHVYPALLTFYLVDVITTYLFHHREEGRISRDGQELLDRWEGLLARILKSNRIYAV